MTKDHGKDRDNGAVAEAQAKDAATAKTRCGLVMPISEIDGCTASHWADVKTILIEALDAVGFTAELVSQAEDVGTIHKRIIQHLYEDPIIVCDVSGKNANVMFELGLRLAFDKPTIIVKDDKTGYSFDTSPIEHLTYPRDLRFGRIVDFKRDLGKKVLATVEAAKKPEYTTFLKHFGTFTVAKLDTREVSKDQFMLEQLGEIRSMIARDQAERERERERMMLDSRKRDSLSFSVSKPAILEAIRRQRISLRKGAEEEFITLVRDQLNRVLGIVDQSDVEAVVSRVAREMAGILTAAGDGPK